MTSNLDLHALTRAPRRVRLSLLLALSGLAACATPQYRPLVVDSARQGYPTDIQVAPGAVLVRDTSIHPRQFPVVMLGTSTHYRPTWFQFAMREALAQLGETRVFTPAEFRNLMQDHQQPTDAPQLTMAAVQKFSTEVKPVLIVDIAYVHVDAYRERCTLKVTDGRTGKRLLEVNHLMSSANSREARVLYPVLNELRAWYTESSRRSV